MSDTDTHTRAIIALPHLRICDGSHWLDVTKCSWGVGGRRGASSAIIPNTKRLCYATMAGFRLTLRRKSAGSHVTD